MAEERQILLEESFPQIFPSNEEVDTIISHKSNILQGISPEKYDINLDLNPLTEPYNLHTTRETTIDDVNQEIPLLESLLKYDCFINSQLKNRLWFQVIDELDEKYEPIKEKIRKDEYSEGDEIDKIVNNVVIPKYKKLIKDKEQKQQQIEENGIAPEDRFNPSWFESVIALWKNTMNGSPSLSKFKTVPTVVVNSAKNNGNENDWQNIYNWIKDNYDEECANAFIRNGKRLAIESSTTPQKSKAWTKYKENNAVARVLCLNPYVSPVITLQTIWHETTHWIQEIDEDMVKEKMKLWKRMDELKKSGKKEDKEEMEMLKNGDNELILFEETQANLMGSMVAYIQAKLSGCENIEFVERELMRTTECSMDGRGYCDFSLTKYYLNKLKTDGEFLNKFIDNDHNNIDFEKLYNFTAEITKRQCQEIKNFAENNGKMYSQMIKDSELMENPNNPLCIVNNEKIKYYKENPKTEIEKLQDDINNLETKYYEHESKRLFNEIYEKGKNLKQLENFHQTLHQSSQKEEKKPSISSVNTI